MSVVEEIHKAFFTASDFILGTNRKKAAKLLALGFTQAKGVKEHKKASIYDEYAVKYPKWKFITHKEIESICEKYNLVCAPIDRYRGDVPDKNIMDIEAFLLDMGDKIIHKGVITHNNNSAPKSVSNPFNAWGRKQPRTISITEIYDKWEELGGTKTELEIVKTEDFTAKNCLHICAPKTDMDLTGLVQDKNQFHVPDPVVLCKVPHGALVVTAWGAEAMDVVNEILN